MTDLWLGDDPSADLVDVFVARAAAYLESEPRPGERIDEIQTRHVAAEYWMLRARLLLVQRQRDDAGAP